MSDDKEPKSKISKETLYIDVEDEITSIIHKLEASSAQLAVLVLPKRSTVLQSIVNMRLLKRAADKASKKIVLITSDENILPLAGAAEIMVAKNQQSKPYVPISPVKSKKAALKINQPDAEEIENFDEDEEIDEKSATLDEHRSAGELAVSGDDVDDEADEPETIKLDQDEPEDEKLEEKSEPKFKIPGFNFKKPKLNLEDKKLKVPNFDKFRISMFVGIVGVIGLIVFFFLATKVLPKATIDIQTTSTSVSANFDATSADNAKSVDTTKNIIPGFLKTSDQSQTQQATATGQQNSGDKSRGTVTMTAVECSTSAPSSVPAGTAVNSGGLTYITQATTKFSNSGTNDGHGCITYASTSTTDITAQVGGSKYNVSSGTSFTVSSRSDVTATGTSNGGTDNNVTVVAQADLDKAKASITSQSSDSFSKTFQQQLDSQGYYVVASTLKVGDPVVTATPDVGQAASTVSVKITIKYSVLAFKKDDLKQLVSAQLQKQIDTSKQQILGDNVLNGVSITVQNQLTNSANTPVSVSVSASATPNINPDSIKASSKGKKTGAIKDEISNIPGVKQVDIYLSPFWVSSIPNDPSKIKVSMR